MSLRHNLNILKILFCVSFHQGIHLQIVLPDWLKLFGKTFFAKGKWQMQDSTQDLSMIQTTFYTNFN